jgi:hypothetical protein
MLATIEDLAALGALPLNAKSSTPEYKRAVRLLELASAQVVTYLRYDDEAALTDALTEAQLTVVAAVVAEAAGARMNVSAAASTDPYADQAGGLVSSLLNRRHYRTLDKLLGRAGRGSRTIDTDRDEVSSFLSRIPPGTVSESDFSS